MRFKISPSKKNKTAHLLGLKLACYRLGATQTRLDGARLAVHVKTVDEENVIDYLQQLIHHLDGSNFTAAADTADSDSTVSMFAIN